MGDEDDWTIAELVRNIKRHDMELSRRVTTETYTQAQTNTGERITSLGREITEIQTERRNDIGDKARYRNGMYLASFAAVLSFALSLGLKLVELVAK